ncbi:MAG: helix-turn-helix domain-containing protein [Clostridia bacterium]|nr:helix-turn-helix domain-containing protein [Clostridia bacterium]
MTTYFFQQVINQFQGILNTPIGVIDRDATIVACSESDMIGTRLEGFPYDKIVSESSFIYNNVTYKVFVNDESETFIAFIIGNDSTNITNIEFMCVALFNTKNMRDNRRDKSNFIKSIVLDNILPGDVYLKAHELEFDADKRRVCMLIKINGEAHSSAYDVVTSLFPNRDKDFVISINETDFALVKEIGEGITQNDLEKLAGSLCDMLSFKCRVNAIIGIGRMVNTIKNLATSFKEAQIALEIGNIFEIEKSVVSYTKLGIARLVYQVPTTICKMYLNEVLKKGTIEDLDRETLFTIQCFFENNLNVSETSRRLFVHRNTLVYRLEKIHKITGLDLREFEQAVLFKIAMLVSRYVSEDPMKY